MNYTVWVRICYTSFTEVPSNIEYLRVSRQKTCCFFETFLWNLNRRAGDLHASPGVSGHSVNHNTMLSAHKKDNLWRMRLLPINLQWGRLVCVCLGQVRSSYTSIFRQPHYNIFCQHHILQALHSDTPIFRQPYIPTAPYYYMIIFAWMNVYIIYTYYIIYI